MVLTDLAKKQSGTEAFRLYSLAHLKFQEAARVGTSAFYSYNRWGDMLRTMANHLSFSSIAPQLLQSSIDKFDQAYRYLKYYKQLVTQAYLEFRTEIATNLRMVVVLL